MKKIIKKIIDFFKKLFKKNNNSSPQEEFKYVSFGNPNCANAIEDPKVQIKNLVWSKTKLSYSWKSETKLEQWGITDPHSAEALACFGYLGPDNIWYFGKMEWISSDRLTRDMHNVITKYNGIDPDIYFSAKKHGFFIMESNGKRRSNIIIA